MKPVPSGPFSGFCPGNKFLALVSLAALVACKSPSTTETPGPADEGGTASSGGTQSVDVQVSGAKATRTGDSTIRLEYPESDDINDRIPDWVINPAIGGVTGAVGVAASNDLGIREQLDEARLNGRLELASMLELRVQRVGRSELEQDIRVEGGTPGNRSRRNTLGVDRNILDTVLAGTRQRALWFDETSGECYVWMVMDGAILSRTSHKVVEDVSVFVASQVIANEYKPDRKKIEPPTVIVNMPEQPTPAPEPEQPKGPIEQLEESLKPIETIPVDGGSGN
jgi:hypothetical protein